MIRFLDVLLRHNRTPPKEIILATNPRETPEDYVPGSATPQDGTSPVRRNQRLAEDIAEGTDGDDATPEDDGRR